MPDPMTPAEFRVALPAWRRRLGISQRDLAELTGVHLETIRGWEQLRHLPSPLAQRYVTETLERQEQEQGQCTS